MSATKPFTISKHRVYEAFKAVKANAGAAGIDERSIQDFEKDLKDNLYKVWNRMSSGSYFPPPVRAVAILKKDGGERMSASQRWQTAWRRWWSRRPLNRRWSPFSCPTPMATTREIGVGGDRGHAPALLAV